MVLKRNPNGKMRKRIKLIHLGFDAEPAKRNTSKVTQIGFRVIKKNDDYKKEVLN